MAREMAWSMPLLVCEAFRSTLARDEGFVRFHRSRWSTDQQPQHQYGRSPELARRTSAAIGLRSTTGFNRRHQHFAPCGRIS
jgi:hypothetical protein